MRQDLSDHPPSCTDHGIPGLQSVQSGGEIAPEKSEGNETSFVAFFLFGHWRDYPNQPLSLGGTGLISVHDPCMHEFHLKTIRLLLTLDPVHIGVRRTPYPLYWKSPTLPMSSFMTPSSVL